MFAANQNNFYMSLTKNKVQYKEVTYEQFVAELERQYKAFRKDNDKSEVEVAVAIETGYMSVRNCLFPVTQIVSDKVLTSLMKYIEMEGKVEWYEGERSYHIAK